MYPSKPHARSRARFSFNRTPAVLRTTRLIAALAFAFPVFEAQAVTLFWDANLIVRGTGGTGTWAAANANWAPTASGISLGGSGSNAQTWPDSASSNAVFAGTTGTVTISGSVTAGSVDFQTTDYLLTGGVLFLARENPLFGGSIVVNAGATATIASNIDAPVVLGGRDVTLKGPGTLVIASPSRYLGTLSIDGGTLRPKSVDSLGGVAVSIVSDVGRLDFGGISQANVGTMFSASSLELGNTKLFLTGAGDISGLSRLSGTVSGSDGSGILVGSEQLISLRIGNPLASRTTISTGFLHYNGGESSIRNADVTLTQTGSTGFAGRSSLFLETGTNLTVDFGSFLTLTGTPQLHNDAALTITGGSRLSVIRSPAGGEASLRVGFAGGTSKLVVSGEGTAVQSADSLLIGNDSFTASPGVGEVTVGSRGNLGAAILSFGSASSSLLVSDGASAAFTRFDSRAGRNRAGTIRIDGGSFLIGDGVASNLDTGASSFAGKLTGGAGFFTKMGSGDTALTSDASDFAGAVVLQGGRLIVAPGALKNSILSISPAAALAAPLATLDTPLQIGALSGTFDLALNNMTVRLGGGNHSATWFGRFASGTVGLSRLAGTGIQTIAGGTTDAPFTAPFLATSGGAFRLSGGSFRLTNSTLDITARTSLFAEGTTGLIDITDGANVSAGNGVRIHNAGRIRVTGAGSRLTLIPDSVTQTAAVLVGQFGGGTLEVTDGASASGTHFLVGNSAEPDAASSILVARGGTLTVAGLIQLEGRNAALTVDQGTVTTRQLFVRLPESFAGIIRLSDPIAPPGSSPLTASVALTVRPPATAAFTNILTITDGPSGPGSLAFVGTNFQQTLGGTLTYTGRTIVDGEGVQLTLTSPLASRELIARNGAAMTFAGVGAALPWDAGRANFRTDATSTIAFEGTRLVGGVLRGTGFQVNGPNASRFDGTALGINSRLTANGEVAWSNAALQGRLDTHASVNLDNVTISTGGSVILRSSTTFTDVENNGLLDLRNGAEVTVIGDMASGGGSRILVADGAMLLGGDRVILNGALMKNNGAITTPLVVEYQGTAKGAGSFGLVTVNDGGTFSPGNSPGIAHTGSVTFNEGSRYEVEVADALGAPGTGFDLWDVDGDVAFHAGTTANSQFVISLISLDIANAPGLARNFDVRHSFAWTVLRADSVSGFDPDEVRLDTGGFQNSHDGQFGLALSTVDGRSELQIVYQPVPEPATNAMIVGGLAALAVWRRRQRRS